jgi:hypothetical protein
LAERVQQFRKKIPPRRSYLPVPVTKSRMGFRMPQGKELKFQRDQNQTAVLGKFRVMPSQSREFFSRTFLLAQRCGDIVDSFPDPLVQQGEEDVFLALKIRIKRAASITRAGGNLFQPSGFETVPGKNALGGIEQLAPGRRSAFDLAGVASDAYGRLNALFLISSGLQSESSRNAAVVFSTSRVDMIHTCMYLTWVVAVLQVVFAGRLLGFSQHMEFGRNQHGG